MVQISDIPNELLLLFFSRLPLKALIATRGVNRHWRQLVPRANILPARRSLLSLYLRIIASSLFIPTRPWILSRLQPFDRKGYLDNLLEKYQYLPEDFCIWVLEWPARAAIRGSWPGLPVCGAPQGTADNVEKIGGYNWLGPSPPRLSSLSLGRLPYGSISALCLWVGGGEITWLSLDARDGQRGRVYELYTDGYWVTTEDNLDDVENVYPDFIEWQKGLWEKVERAAGYSFSYTWAKLDAATGPSSGLLGERGMVSNGVPPAKVKPWSKKKDSGCF